MSGVKRLVDGVKRSVDAQRVIAALTETQLALQLVHLLTPGLVESDDFDERVGDDIVAELITAHVNLEDDYANLIQQNTISRQKVTQAHSLDQQIQTSFREIHRLVRQDASLLKRLTLVDDQKTWMPATRSIFEYCELSQQHVRDIAERVSPSLSMVDRRHHKQKLVVERDELLSRKAELEARLEREQKQLEEQQNRQQLQLSRLEKEKQSLLDQLDVNSEQLTVTKTREFTRLDTEHSDRVKELHEEIE